MKTENLKALKIHKMSEEIFKREKESGNIKENEIYLTPYDATERQALIAEVIDSLRVEQPEAHIIYGDVDDKNNIVIYGELQNGTYTVKYENEDGTLIEIGKLVKGNLEEPENPNEGNDIVWLNGKKLDKANGSESTGENYMASTAIPIEGYTYTIVMLDCEGTGLGVCYYNASNEFISFQMLYDYCTTSEKNKSFSLVIPEEASYFRIRLSGLDTDDFSQEATYTKYSSRVSIVKA